MTAKNTSGFRLPAEWEKHSATWIGWPDNKEDWPGKIAPIPWVYGEMVRKIAEGEIVNILVNSGKHKIKAERVLDSVHADINNVRFHVLSTDRNWLRDSGPVFVQGSSKNVEMIHFRFNAWAKYPNHKKDAKIPSFISRKLNVKRTEAIYENRHVVLEGGAIDINGSGTLITTEECLMHPDIQVRNPGFTKNDYEKVFGKYLGISNVIWLGDGIAGDDTHGHVDDLCRFVNKNTLVLVQEKNPTDKNYNLLNENRERLESARLEDGSKPDVIELPMPEPVIFKGERLPASYANFYISNAYVLVPTFNDPNDRIALGVLSELFPDRKVAGIHAVDLVWGLGTIHCLTKEQCASVK